MLASVTGTSRRTSAAQRTRRTVPTQLSSKGSHITTPYLVERSELDWGGAIATRIETGR